MSTTELDLITDLGARDGVLDDLDKRIAAAEARIPKAQAGVAAATEALDLTEAALKASKDAEKTLAREVRTYEQRRDAATRALEGGHGDPEMAERQIAQCSDILDDLETKQLEQMETTESASEHVAAAKTALAEAESTLTAAQTEVPPILADLRSKRAAAQSARDAVWEQVPAEVQNRYALIRKKRKTAVSLLVDGYCSPCRRKIPLQEASDVRVKGLLRMCSSCGRYLVLPPE